MLSFCVACLRCLLLRRCSTAAAFYDRFILLRFAGVSRVNWDMRLLDLVFGLLLLAASAIVLVCDRVLRASALLLTVDLVWAWHRLRALCFANILLLGRKSCGSILVVLSTLVTAVGGTLGTCGMSLTILLVLIFFCLVFVLYAPSEMPGSVHCSLLFFCEFHQLF